MTDCTHFTFQCSTCSIKVAIDTDIDKSLRETGRDFYCPNGHILAYKKEEIDRVKKITELKANIERLEKENNKLKDKIKRLEEELELWKPREENKK